MCPTRCAEQDVADLTGIRVAAKTQQRLVHCQTFVLPSVQEAIGELCVDGGKVRVRTPIGQECQSRISHKPLKNHQNSQKKVNF